MIGIIINPLNQSGRRLAGAFRVRLMPRLFQLRTGLCRLLLVATIAGLCARAQAAPVQTPASAPLDQTILTNFGEIWRLAGNQTSRPHRIITEVVIYYFDAEWNSVWGECQGIPMFLPIGDSPQPLKPGQRVAIDGAIAPVQERMVWDQTRLRILEEGVERKAEAVRGLIDKPSELSGRLILVEGLVDSQKVGPTHLTLSLLTRDTTASVYVLRDAQKTLPHFNAGDFIRIKAVYAPQLDRDGKLENLDLWVAQPTNIEVVGSLSTDPNFSITPTPIDEIQEGLATNRLVCVHGTVRKHEVGKWVVVWDDTGQVTLESRQTQPLRLGDRIEAIGYPYVRGVHQKLRNATYRPAKSISTPVATAPATRRLRIAEQIRDLSHEEAASGLPVTLRALVTWSHAGTPFAYLQDSSGGIRVANPKWDSQETSKPGTIVMLEGTTAEGNFVPLVTNAVLRRVGWRNLNAEKGQPITLEQALTGLEEGRWVEMAGYVREVTEVAGLRHLELTTSSGEFEAWLPSSRTLKYLEGSIVRVQGVCVAAANSRRQLTGVQIWIPESKYILVEEPESADVFAAPLRALASLRRFSLDSSLHRKIRTFGTVVLHTPGRYLYVQDGSEAVFALSRQQDPLQPGDRVEVVGFPGNQGRRFLLREAVYRRIETGAEPVPVQLSAVQSVNVDLEGLLSKAEGLLLNATEKNGEARLLIHAADSAFEANLPAAPGAKVSTGFPTLEPGSRLAVTGVYEVQSDEYGNPRSFLLRLRSWDDVKLLQQPPWWTLKRLLRVLVGVMAVSLLALAWVFLIAHKNTLLRHAQNQLKTVNDQLEHRVQERTSELEAQVAAKERARAELAEAQEHLVLTSRQAGMAEVATGVLHNVGNVLNSVNVSTGVLNDRLRSCPLESVTKAAALLRNNQIEIAHFLSEDRKGKALIPYMEKLGEVLEQDKQGMLSELELLAKNVDHIKIIVAMQQSYAKVGGVLEELEPKDLLEDAIQINSASLVRDQIQLNRDYQDAPKVMVDRHKVLQILVNLISNARHALSGNPAGRDLTLRIAYSSPDCVCIEVKDKGIGIAPENLGRIFSQGFTTRKDGHGFGLHSGANAANELGGSLSVVSEGVGCGATFSLRLPTAIPAVPAPKSDSVLPETAPKRDSHRSQPEVPR